MTERVPQGISEKQFRARGRLNLVTKSFLRNEDITSNPSGTELAEELIKQGDGLLVVMNHFGRTDLPHVMRALMNNPVFSEHKILSAIAQHQTYPGLLRIASNVGVDLHSLVTNNSVTRADVKGNPDDLRERDGMEAFLNASAETLSKGQIVVLPTQGERQSTLQVPDKPTLGAFMANTIRRRGVTNFGVYFMGVGIQGATNYEDHSGWNLRKKYSLNGGSTFTAEDALELAGGYREFDSWATNQLATVVPEAYLP